MDWEKVSAIVLCLFVGISVLLTLKRNPELLSKENLGKSASTVGILALILIGFVGLLVMLVRSGS